MQRLALTNNFGKPSVGRGGQEARGILPLSSSVAFIELNLDRRPAINRPFLADPAPHMRPFVIIDPEGTPVAILDFDPTFSNGKVTGYTAAFERKLTGTTPHAEVGLTKFATDRFREEGRTLVTLGLSPLAVIAAIGFAESRIWRSLFQRASSSERINEKIFNLQGQAAFKRRFHGKSSRCSWHSNEEPPWK